MNKSHRSIWNESLGAWVATSETTSRQGKRAGSVVALVASSLLLAAAAPAWADFSQAGFAGATCARQGSGLGTGTWTCQVPNNSGGFATVSGVPDDGSGAQPDYTALTNWVTSSLGANSIAMGSLGTKASGANAVAIGDQSNAGAAGAVALGSNTSVTQAGGVALGQNSVANRAAGTGTYVPLGASAGDGTTITNTKSSSGAVSVGSAGNTRQITNVAGGLVNTDAVNVAQLRAVANAAAAGAVHYYSVNDGGTLGANYTNNGATGLNSLAAGVGASAGGPYATAVGEKSVAGEENATAIGSASIASGNSSTAVGNSNKASESTAVAIGASNEASGVQSIAVGTVNKATGLQSTAIGAFNDATGTYSISVGSINTASGQSSIVVGRLSESTASNAIAVGTNTHALATNAIALGSGARAELENNVSLGTGSVDKAVVQVNSATIPGVIATLNPDGTVTYSAGPTITYGGFAGTASGVVSVGSVGAERQIVNVAPGAITANSTDAVNGSQLYSVASQVNAISGNITTIVNNASSHFYSVNGGTSTDGNYANNGASAAGAIASGINASASAANSVAMGTNAAASTANSVALGANTTTTAATPTAGTTIRGTNYAFAGANPTGVVSVGSAGAERQIQNVAAGQLNANSTDAVNGSQLHATNQALETISVVAGAGINVTTAATGTGIAIGTSVANVGPGGTATYTAGNNMVLTQNGANTTFAVNDNPNFTSVQVGNTSITNNGVSIANGPSMTTSGINAGGSTITNVAPGVNGTDAVNVNQLNASSAGLRQQITGLDNRIERQGKELSGGIAASAAMAVVTPVEPGRYHVSGAVAAYNGQAGIGFNLLKRSDNGQSTLHAGVGFATGGSKAIVRVGFGFSFD